MCYKFFSEQHDSDTKFYQVLSLRVRVDLEAMVMKRYSTFTKAPSLPEPHHQIVQSFILDIHWVGGILLLCREADDVFYSHSRLGNS